MNRLMMFHLFFQSQQRLMLFKLLECALKKLLIATILKKLRVLVQVNTNRVLAQVTMNRVLAQVTMKSGVLLMVTIANRMIMDMMMKVTTTTRIPTILVRSLATVRDQGLRLHLSISIVVKKSISITKRGLVVSLMQTMNQDLFPISILHLNHLLIIALEILVVFPTIR